LGTRSFTYIFRVWVVYSYVLSVMFNLINLFLYILPFLYIPYVLYIPYILYIPYVFYIPYVLPLRYYFDINNIYLHAWLLFFISIFLFTSLPICLSCLYLLYELRPYDVTVIIFYSYVYILLSTIYVCLVKFIQNLVTLIQTKLFAI